MNGIGEGLFGIFMAFVVLAGMLGLAFIGAKLIMREPKCADCGWREGHRMSCRILARLIEADVARERRILDLVRAGKLDIEQAKVMLKW